MNAPNVIISLQMLEALKLQKRKQTQLLFPERNKTKVAAKSNCVTRFLCFFGCLKQAGEFCHSTKLMTKQRKGTLLHILGYKENNRMHITAHARTLAPHTHTPYSNKISSFKMSKQTNRWGIKEQQQLAQARDENQQRAQKKGYQIKRERRNDLS